jgi:MFS transporter, OFA family, oxalate/formate antiporter
MKQYDPSVTVSFMAIVFPFLGLITDSVLSFGVKLAEKIGFKIMVFMCGSSISIAFLAVSFITNIYGFIAIYCVMIGLATGLVYMLPVCT